MTKTPYLVPLPIKIFCWALVLVGLYFSWALYFKPQAFIPGGDFSVVGIRMTAGFLASRAFAMVAVLIIALILNQPRLLALILVMRALTELQDGTILYTSMHVLPATIPAIVMFTGEVLSIIFLIKGIKRASAAEA